ncbi:hypothetical protein MKW98_026660 [Papaver atlanticum]|uniref:BTB domain-containing protein n=1 Tax=Papaver atlanticum TaxID=357466 RepID=A0AAD4S054_9MAGN|nr:hypothetical protein MKW98_026660 [Papaver atlanticum]
MFCSICKKTTVNFSNNYGSDYAQNIRVRDGVVVCNSCYKEVNNIMNLIYKDKKDRSISYPEDTDWGKRWIEEMMKERDDFLGDLAVTFREGVHSDIQVKPGSGLAIPAHKFMLRLHLSLSEFNHEELKTFLEFLYRGNLAKEKFEKHFFSLSIAADKYVIPHLQKFCEQQLLNSLDSTNALKVLEISELCSNETLKLAALRSILQYKNEIFTSPYFEEFAKQNPHLMVDIKRAFMTPPSDKKI